MAEKPTLLNVFQTHYLPTMFSRCGVCHKICFISPAFPNLEEGSSGTERIAQAIGPVVRAAGGEIHQLISFIWVGSRCNPCCFL